jgi:transcriptional antiterminator RfaH
MTADTDAIRWFAVMTGPRMEFTADRNLRRQGLHTWLPFQRIRRKRKLPNRPGFRLDWVEEPYFPRYLFVALRKPTESVYQINETDGIATVVYQGGEPLPIPHGVIDELMGRANGDGLVGVVDPTKRKRFAPGDHVRFVDDSPFAGLLALVNIDKGPNIRLWVDVLGKKHAISVPPSAVAAAR